MTKITMYTDGAARGNPDGPGGYGTILSFVDSKGQEHIKELSAGYQKTTNNRMEMMAVIAGMEALNRPCEITVYSDSQYVVKAFNEHWLDGWIKKGWKRGKNELFHVFLFQTQSRDQFQSSSYLYELHQFLPM